MSNLIKQSNFQFSKLCAQSALPPFFQRAPFSIPVLHAKTMKRAQRGITSLRVLTDWVHSFWADWVNSPILSILRTPKNVCALIPFRLCHRRMNRPFQSSSFGTEGAQHCGRLFGTDKGRRQRKWWRCDAIPGNAPPTFADSRPRVSRKNAQKQDAFLMNRPDKKLHN